MNTSVKTWEEQRNWPARAVGSAQSFLLPLHFHTMGLVAGEASEQEISPGTKGGTSAQLPALPWKLLELQKST